MLFGIFVLEPTSTYGNSPLTRGREYSDIRDVCPGPKHGVRLQKVSTVTCYNKQESYRIKWSSW